MKRVALAVLAVLAGLVSCTEMISEKPEETGKYAVDIVFTGAVGRSGLQPSPGERKLNVLKVFVYDSNGYFETEAAVKINADGVSASASATVSNGFKTIWAVANFPGIDGSKCTAASIADEIVPLSAIAPDSIVMSGSDSRNISGNTCFEIPLKRIVSKVCLSSVKRVFSDAGKAALQLVVEEAYLSNVPGEAFLSGKTTPESSIINWYNRLGAHSDAFLDAILHRNGLNRNILQGETYAPSDIFFYTYRNPSPSITRLVLKTSLAGLSTPFYYVVDMPPLVPNLVYDVSLTLTRPGSPDPDNPEGEGVVNLNVSPSISVADWDEVIPIFEKF